MSLFLLGLRQALVKHQTGSNNLGDQGLVALAAPLRKHPTLTKLFLHGNQIGGAGMAEFSRAISSGSLGALTHALTALYLDFNQIGDSGIAEFSRAISSGSLRALTHLFLGGNQIGDAGMTDLSHAIASGSLPALQDVYLSVNLGSDAPVMEALAARKK